MRFLSADTSTSLSDAFNTNSIRGATSSDGNAIWVSGNGSAASGGIRHTLLGNTTSVSIASPPANSRVTNIFFEQLYADAASGAFMNVFAVGSGLPTSPGQNGTVLPGLPNTGQSPYAFVMFDLDPTVPGGDTLYVPDDRSFGNGGGIEKYTLSGGTWSLVTTFTAGFTGVLRAVTGQIESGQVRLFVTSSTNTRASSVYTVVDDGVALNPTAVLLASSPANYVFRGVALSPVP